MFFDAGGDGATFEALYMPVGGVRQPPRPEMFSDADGARFASDYILDAATLGRTAAGELPDSARRVLQLAETCAKEIDGCYFSPLAFQVEAEIRRRVGLSRDQFHSHVPEFGGSGSGSIPLAMLARGASRLGNGRQTSLLGAMGPGLAWSSAVLTTEDVVCPEILEV